MTKNVLIIDDHDQQRRILRCVLEAADCSITEAVSGRDALDKVGVDEFDCIVLDYHMPDMTGIEVLEAIQNTLTSPQCPKYVVVTSSQSKAVSNSFKSLGCQAVLNKPINPERFLEVVLG